jgi:TRAP-type C4-dicarboxylate transport system permease large subunit
MRGHQQQGIEVVERLPAIVLFGPLLFPAAKAMGVHEVHCETVVILGFLRWESGSSRRPSGLGLQRLCNRPHQPKRLAVAHLAYIGALIASLVVVAAIPWLSVGFL